MSYRYPYGYEQQYSYYGGYPQQQPYMAQAYRPGYCQPGYPAYPPPQPTTTVVYNRNDDDIAVMEGCLCGLCLGSLLCCLL